MIEVLLWFIAIELTAALAIGGYVLYNMQLDIATIALHDCADHETITVITSPSLTDKPVVIDERETAGTFAGPQAWN